MSEQPTPPPGWYPDSERPGGTRYWDGASWTEHRAAGSSPQPPPPSAGTAWSQASAAVGVQGTNALAIASLVTAILGVSIGAIVCGHLAIGQIERTGEGGRGLAIAGLIIGYVTAVVQLMVLLAIIGIAAGRT